MECGKCGFKLICINGEDICITCPNVFEKELRATIERLEAELTAKEMDSSLLAQKAGDLETTLQFESLQKQQMQEQLNIFEDALRILYDYETMDKERFWQHCPLSHNEIFEYIGSLIGEKYEPE